MREYRSLNQPKANEVSEDRALFILKSHILMLVWFVFLESTDAQIGHHQIWA